VERDFAFVGGFEEVLGTDGADCVHVWGVEFYGLCGEEEVFFAGGFSVTAALDELG